ncbi:nitroreductase family protein [Metabacillus sp. B2-18]|uniref:nitroreductase family protein n=1 Tax=Metabacillus sp. B2-18 TaxID=2897333 RepID=UPI001E36D591|nr:nitroreductase [Metabacillus sp. B2-18]UGB29987.1 nitroreductase [Metabacillus sp. B2-18]
MDVLSAIATRRSIGKVKEDPVPSELIHQILEAGTWAPSHFRTEPWRFFVLTGDARKALGKTLASLVEKTLEDPNSEESQKRLEREENKPLRAPVIIAVAVEPTTANKRVMMKEEVAAVCAAVQNMLLTAHALGLGAIWRTGESCYSNEVKELFTLSSESEMVGLLYIGYPDMKEMTGKRQAVSAVTTWLENEEDFA